MFGRQAQLPIDLVYRTRNADTPVNEYALQLKERLEDAYALVREKLNASHEHQKKYYDKHVHGDPFKIGDLVWGLLKQGLDWDWTGLGLGLDWAWTGQ